MSCLLEYIDADDLLYFKKYEDRGFTISDGGFDAEKAKLSCKCTDSERKSQSPNSL